MADPFAVCGKQIINGTKHIADARDDAMAQHIARLLNLDAMDDQELADLFSDAMSDVQDFDTGIGDLAKAAVRRLRKVIEHG